MKSGISFKLFKRFFGIVMIASKVKTEIIESSGLEYWSAVFKFTLSTALVLG